VNEHICGWTRATLVKVEFQGANDFSTVFFDQLHEIIVVLVVHGEFEVEALLPLGTKIQGAGTISLHEYGVDSIVDGFDLNGSLLTVFLEDKRLACPIKQVIVRL